MGLHFIFKNNKFPEFAATSFDLSLISFGIFILYFIITFIQSRQFYKQLNFKAKPLNPMLMLFGFPFYGIAHFLFRNKIKEDLNLSSIENIN